MRSEGAPFFDEAEAREQLDLPRVGLPVQYIRGTEPQLVRAAALVTKVHSATSVNLCVFADGSPPTYVSDVPRRCAEIYSGDCWERL